MYFPFAKKKKSQYKNKTQKQNQQPLAKTPQPIFVSYFRKKISVNTTTSASINIQISPYLSQHATIITVQKREREREGRVCVSKKANLSLTANVKPASGCAAAGGGS